MKKVIAITLALLVLAGCSSETYRTGLGMVNSIDFSKSATAEKAGLAQADVTAAAVMVDSKDTIVSISFDSVQPKIAFDATGAVTTDLNTSFKTKKELGDEYGMKPASAIGKEWHEQIYALEQYALGKTVQDFTSMPLKDNGDHPNTPDVEDLASSCTMTVSEFLEATTKAVANAK